MEKLPDTLDGVTQLIRELSAAKQWGKLHSLVLSCVRYVPDRRPDMDDIIMAL